MTTDNYHSEISVSHRIKQLRLAKGLTQKAFAASLGIVQGYLSGIERGKKIPSHTLLMALCHIYGVREEWLAGGNDAKFAETQPNDHFSAGIADGDFMAPTIRDGDLVIFKPGKAIGNRSIVLLNNRWGEAILRRCRVKGDEVYYSAENSVYAPFKADANTIILGTVVNIWRKVKI